MIQLKAITFTCLLVGSRLGLAFQRFVYTRDLTWRSSNSFILETWPSVPTTRLYLRLGLAFQRLVYTWDLALCSSDSFILETWPSVPATRLYLRLGLAFQRLVYTREAENWTEAFDLLRCYAAQVGSCLPTFRGNISVPSSRQACIQTKNTVGATVSRVDAYIVCTWIDSYRCTVSLHQNKERLFQDY